MHEAPIQSPGRADAPAGHWAEYRAQIPNKRRVRRRYVRADTGEQWIDSLDDTDGNVEWAGGDYFSQILLDFLATGQARSGRVGNCNAERLPGAPFVAFAVAWLQTHFRGLRKLTRLKAGRGGTDRPTRRR